MKRPLVAVALAYAGGLLVAEFFQPSLVVLFSLALALAAGSMFWRGFGHWLLWPLLILAGWTNMVARTAIISPHDLRCVFGDSPQIVAVRGTLPETPSQRIYVREEQEFSRSLSLLQVDSVRRGSE